jgi:hypothetical protein
MTKRRQTYQRKPHHPVEIIGWVLVAVILAYAIGANSAY